MTFPDIFQRNQHSISTHTPLAGRDRGEIDHNSVSTISTHTPLAGRDARSCRGGERACKFLLTRPSRDVTLERRVHVLSAVISTHTPLAGRDFAGRSGSVKF